VSPAAELASFVELRHRIGATGWFPGADEALAAELTAAVAALAGPLPGGVAILAVGGFGRGALALRSDADLWILHTGGPVDGLAGRVFRPLWDAGLRVGHGVHTPESARRLAAERLDAVCMLLTARLVAGDGRLAERLTAGVARLVDRHAGLILDRLAVEEADRRRAEPYLEMAADLKAARGGIRTLDLVDWRRRIVGGEPDPRERGLRSDLLELRSALHAVTGRAHDRYDFELRAAAAVWAGTGIRELGRRLLATRVAVEDLVVADWIDGVAPRPAFAAPKPDQAPLRTVAAALARARPDLSDLPLPVAPLSASDRAFVLHLFTDEVLVRRLASAGWLAGVVPGVVSLRVEPHVVAFHRYAVFDHLLATLAEVRRLTPADPGAPLLAEILPGEDLVLVSWAALFHDLGKGGEGDHSRLGAERARSETLRLGFGEHDVAVLVRLVELHLLLPDLGTRFDVDDPGVVSWAADRIGDPATLRRLYLLTVADSRATGSDTWSPWRAELVRRAYRRIERELARRAVPEEESRELLADAVVAAGAGAGRAAVLAHLAGFPPSYRWAHTPREIAVHVAVAARPIGPEGVVTELIEPDHPGGPAYLVVSCADRRGLLTVIAGTLALHRLSVVDARVATRSDGRVFDTFAVVGDPGVGPVRPETLAAFARDLGRAVRGGFDVEGALAAKQEAYRHTRREGVSPGVSVRRLPSGGGVVEIEAADRLGLLHDVCRIIAAHGMGIVRARVDTRAGVAYDSFTVERLPSDPGPFVGELGAVL